MKLFAIVALIIWFGCGFAAAWWMDDHRWKIIARGPISLVQAYNDAPEYYPKT